MRLTVLVLGTNEKPRLVFYHAIIRGERRFRVGGCMWKDGYHRVGPRTVH